jgi:hypothetical protein
MLCLQNTTSFGSKGPTQALCKYRNIKNVNKFDYKIYLKREVLIVTLILLQL